MKLIVALLACVLAPLSYAEEGKECRKVYETAKAAGGDPIDGPNDKFFFSTRAKTQKVADAVKNYPGKPKAAKRILQRLAKLPADSGADLSGLLGYPTCPVVGYFTLVKALIDSTAHHKFDPKDSMELKEIILSYVRADLDGPSDLLSVLTRINLTKRMVSSNLIDGQKFDLAKLEELDTHGKELQEKIEGQRKKWERITNAKQYRSLASAERKKLNMTWRNEMLATERLRGELKTLLATVKFELPVDATAPATAAADPAPDTKPNTQPED